MIYNDDRVLQYTIIYNHIYIFIIFIRYIIHNDENNPVISSFNAFDKILSSTNLDLLVVSGLQMMDNYPFREGNVTI